MAFLSIPNVKIAGVSAAVPRQIKDIPNLPFFAPGEAEKVMSLTGIRSARVAPQNMCCSDLCYEAAENLVSSLQWNKSDIGILVYVTLSRDYITPPTSNLLQQRLGLSTECYAIDIPLACSGYVYGLSVISSLMSVSRISKGLLLVGETTSKQQSPLDKTIWPLHGDAGTATAIEYEEHNCGFKFHFGGDGARGEAIINPDGGYRNPLTPESLEMTEILPGITRSRIHAILDGMNVFSFSLHEPPKSIIELCNHFAIELNGIDYLLLHQANKYMDDKIVKKLKIDSRKVPYCLQEYGNTSSATIPLTMVTKLSDPLSNCHLKMIACGFGSGLSWGSGYFETDKIACIPLLEI